MTIPVRNNYLRYLFLTYIIRCFIQISPSGSDHLFTIVSSIRSQAPPDTQLRLQRHPKELPSPKIGLLKCVARSVAPIQRHNESLKEERKNASADASTNASGPSNGPHIIFLPPIEDSKGEEDSNSDREHEAREVHVDPEDQQELLSEATNDQYEDYETYDTKKQESQDFNPNGNETVNQNRHATQSPSRAPVKFDRAPKSRSNLWTLLERPLSKLIPNQRQRYDAEPVKQYDQSILGKRRPKRQANVDLTEQLIRALASNGLGLGDQVSANSRNILQQVLVSMNLLVQQLLSLFIRQATADLPAHMANLGKLASNLITALTLDNPLLINSPALLRSQQSGFNLDALSRQNSSLVLTAQQLITNMGRLIREMAVNRSAATQASASRTTTSTASPIELTGSSRVEVEDRDVAFVRRLNELTLGIMRPETMNGSSTGAARAKREVKSSSPIQSRSSHRAGRSKRSIGSLLMFGPFSKFYLAMMMNRVIKYQSGVFSQAVMGELVKRFVLPGVSSALGDTKPLGLANVSSNLLQQLKQSLSGPQAGSSPQQNPAISLSDKKPATEALGLAQAESNSVHEQEKAANEQRASAVTFDADCQLVNPQNENSDHQSLTHLTDPRSLLHPFATPADIMAAAITNPAISLDKQGLSFSLPSSQTRVTIPNLLNGQHSVQSLLRLVTSGLLNGTQSEGPFVAPMPFALPVNFSHPQVAAPHLRSSLFNPVRLYGNPIQRAPPYTGGSNEFAQGAKSQDELVSKLLEQVATTTKTTALLLEAHLKQASPKQLLELLAQTNAQQKAQQLSRGSVGDRPDIGSILAAMQHLNNSSPRDDMAPGNNVQSVNFMADKILNRTLSMSLSRLLAGNDATKSSPDQSDRLLKETSDLLADSFAQLIKGEFERDRMNREKASASIPSRSRDKMTADHANLMIDKLLALSRNASSNPDSDWSTMPPLEPDWQTSAPPLINSQLDQRGQQQFGDWSIQAAGSESNQLDSSSNSASEGDSADRTVSEVDSMGGNDLAIRELIKQELEGAGLGESHIETGKPRLVLPHSKGKVAREEVGEQVSVGRPISSWRESSRVHPHEADRDNYNKSSTGSSISLEGGFKPVGSRITKLRPQPKLLKQVSSSQSDSIVVAGQPGDPFIHPPVSSVSSKLSSPDDPQKITLGKTIMPQQQQARHNTLLAPTRSQAEQDLTQIGDKTSSSSISQVRLAANNPDKSRQISSGREESSSGDLNNLAMALNVMNMVLLNQKLANGSATPTEGIRNSGSAANQAPTISHLLVHQLDPKIGSKTEPTKTVGAQGVTGNPSHGTARGELEREGQAAKRPVSADKSQDNHRTSSNIIRQNATLLLTPNGTTAHRKQSSKVAGNRPASYLFQPLVISKNNTGSPSLNATSINQVGKQTNNSFDEPEKDHAARWNDVLQHISLAS